MATVSKELIMVRDSFITKIYNKRKLLEEKTKEVVPEYREAFKITLNKRNASLLVVTLAFVTRYLYYGKVEEVRFEDYFEDEDFGEVFYQLRMMLLLLNENCKKNFKDYKEYKIFK